MEHPKKKKKKKKPEKMQMPSKVPMIIKRNGEEAEKKFVKFVK